MKLLLILLFPVLIYSSDSSSSSSSENSSFDEKSTATKINPYEYYCKECVNKKVKPISCEQWDKNNKTFIDFIKSYDVEGARKLLESGEVDVNSKIYHWIALMWTAKEGHEDLVKLLLEYKADINYTDEISGTALDWAACYGHTKIVDLLTKYFDRT